MITQPSPELSLAAFERMLGKKYGSFYFPFARNLFKEYGPLLSVLCASALLYAETANQKKVCLRELKSHFKEVLTLCHPDFRASYHFLNHPAYHKSAIFLNKLITRFKSESLL